MYAGVRWTRANVEVEGRMWRDEGDVGEQLRTTADG
jgi:hypothetical protein